MKVSCIQLNPQEDFNDNINIALKQIKQAAMSGTNTIVLPEMFTYMGNEKNRKNTKCNIGESIFKSIQTAAQEYKINIISGSHAETFNNNEKVFNTCVTYNNSGDIVSVYRKHHLFNLKDETGAPLYCESEVFKAGDFPTPYTLISDSETWKAYNIICYDLRFPEIIRMSTQSPFDVIFIPAAFTWQTGKDHWEVLLRARAIENQCFVVACNQTGFFAQGQKRNYGHSMVIDPWGRVIGKMEEECGILTVDMNKNLIKEVRAKLPALDDRKLK